MTTKLNQHLSDTVSGVTKLSFISCVLCYIALHQWFPTPTALLCERSSATLSLTLSKYAHFN